MEIPIKIMAHLIGAQYLHDFSGDTFIKGFSAMFIPTRHCQDILIWHLVYNETGEHLSYLDHRLEKILKITDHDLANLRHVVGWCPEVKIHTGSTSEVYTFQRARLPRVNSDSLLASTLISNGRFTSDPATFVFCQKYKFVNTLQRGLSKILSLLSQKFILLWDTKDQRGWLVNGVNTLLHLLRASLKFEEKRSRGTVFLLEWSKLYESAFPHSAAAAREFLSDERNFTQRISSSAFVQPCQKKSRLWSRASRIRASWKSYTTAFRNPRESV